jgi:hypothetical protein
MPLPTLPSTVTANASSGPRSCHAISDTEPNVVSRPVLSSRMTSVVPGAIVSSAAAVAAAAPPPPALELGDSGA